MLDFVAVLKAQQERSGLTQAQLANELGVSQSTISAVYRGTREPGVNLLRQVRRRYPNLATEIDLFLAQKPSPDASF